MRIGVFGGTFNPVHLGHLRAAEEAREALGLEQVLWIPAARPPHKEGGGEDVAVPEDRLAMLELALSGNPAFSLLDTEVQRPGPSYTLETLKTLGGQFPGDELFFLVGLDAFAEVPTWHRPAELFRYASFAVLTRPGEDMGAFWSSRFVAGPGIALDESREGPAPPPLRSSCAIPDGKDIFLVSVSGLAVSSTDIRRRVRMAQSIRYLLPAPVESYIIRKGLYLSETRRTGP